MFDDVVCFWYYDELASNFNRENQDSTSYRHINFEILNPLAVDDKAQDSKYSTRNSLTSKVNARPSPTSHPCEHFAFPPPPPADRRQCGPRRKFYLLGLVLNS